MGWAYGDTAIVAQAKIDMINVRAAAYQLRKASAALKATLAKIQHVEKGPILVGHVDNIATRNHEIESLVTNIEQDLNR